MSPPFNANETRYKTDVAKDIKDLNIFAVPENENAKVQINGGTNLKSGNNIVTVVVTAEDGFTTKTYNVEVHKRNDEEQEKYEEEQKEYTPKLEEAYKIEKTSEESNELERKNNSNKIIIIAIIIGVITLAFLLIFAIKKCRNLLDK